MALAIIRGPTINKTWQRLPECLSVNRLISEEGSARVWFGLPCLTQANPSQVSYVLVRPISDR